MGFPYTFAIEFGIEDIEYGAALIDVSGNVELPFDVFSGVAQPKTRKVTVYHSSDSFSPKTIEEDIGAVRLGFKGLLKANIIRNERKMHYLLNTDNDILIVYFDRDLAAYVGLSKATPQNDPGGTKYDIFGIECTTKGEVLGQIREGADSRLVTNGEEVTDTDALKLKAIKLDAAAEYAYFEQQQTDYMLPLTDYKMVARLKQSSGASNNIAKLEVKNIDDTYVNATATKTLTTEFKTYELAFTLDSSANADTIRFTVSREDVSGDMTVGFIGFAAV